MKFNNINIKREGEQQQQQQQADTPYIITAGYIVSKAAVIYYSLYLSF